MSTLATLFAADPARSAHWLFPELKEIIWGVPASLVIGFALWKFGGPPIRKAMEARTEGIKNELDGAEAAKADADAEASQIRQAAGDIDSERARLLEEADAQAEALLRDGRARLDAELAEMEERAALEISATAGRASDELRLEISRISASAVDRLVNEGLDDESHNALIESFIARVGATS